MMDMTNYIQGRSNPRKEEAEFFFDNILGCVHGRNKWKTSKSTARISELVPVSTEAYALLYMLNVEKQTQHKAGLLDVNAPTPKTLWTRGAEAGKGQGWLPAGRQKFSQLCDMVLADRRNDDGAFENWYLEKKRCDSQQIRSRKGRTLPSEIMEDAPYEDPFSDDDVP